MRLASIALSLIAIATCASSVFAQGFIIPQVAAPEATTGNPSQAPFKWAGLLIIPTPTNKQPHRITECTAEFIAPRVLLTAGHCIKNLETNPAGPWPDPTKGTFWLQYQNREGIPFKVVCAATNPLWTMPPNFSSLSPPERFKAFVAATQHDYAMILVDKESPTGAMPYALDWKGKYKFAWRIGYPADILDASIIQRVGGIVFFADAIPLGTWGLPNLVVQWGPVTDATHGMSGGAWVANINGEEGTGRNVLIAVTSAAPVASPSLQGNKLLYPGGSFAAYLTASEFNPLLDYVSGGCKQPGFEPAAPQTPPSPSAPDGRIAPNSQ